MSNLCSKHANTLGQFIKGNSETFDLTGKSNPQYTRYENWGKFLKNKYKGKLVTDPQGNSWWEIDLKPEMKKLPIEAFGALPFMIQQPQKKKEDGQGGGPTTQFSQTQNTIASTLQPAGLGTVPVSPTTNATILDRYPNITKRTQERNVFSVRPPAETTPKTPLPIIPGALTMTSTPATLQPKGRGIIKPIVDVLKDIPKFAQDIIAGIEESPIGSFVSPLRPIEEISKGKYTTEDIKKMREIVRPFFEAKNPNEQKRLLENPAIKNAYTTLLSFPLLHEKNGKMVAYDVMNFFPVGGTKAVSKEAGRIIRQAVKKGLDPESIKRIAAVATERLKPVVSKAAKEIGEIINLKHYSVSDEGKKAIQKTAEALKKEGKLEKFKGPLTHEEVVGAATQSDILQRATTRTQTLNREASILRLRQHAAALSEGKGVKDEFIDAVETLINEGTNLGRQLEALKIDASPDLYSIKSKLITDLRKLGVSIEDIKKAAEGVDFENAKEVTNFYRAFVKPHISEILDEYRYINLLSSPRTHIVNAFTNLLQTVGVAPITKLATGAVDLIGSTLRGVERQAYASEVGPYFRGAVNAIGDAVSSAASVIRGISKVARPDLPTFRPEQIPTGSKLIEKFEFIPRMLEAGDVFFRTIIKAGEMESLTYRAQRQGKVLDDALRAQIEEQASDKAAYYIFRQALDPKNEKGQGYLMSGIDWFTSNVLYRMRKDFKLRRPGETLMKTITNPVTGVKTVIENPKAYRTILNPVKWFIPFVQTPMNILKQGIEYSPAGLLNIPGAKNKTEQIAKAFVGSTVFAGAGYVALTGNATWAAPTNPKEREAFYAAGRKPYSIRIGDNWIGYSKLGPLAYPIAMATATQWYLKENPKAASESTEKRILNIVMGMSGFFSDQSYVQGMGDLVDAMRGEEYAIQRSVTNIPSQIIPLISLQRWVAQIIDPVYRKPETEFNYDSVLQNIQLGLPGLSKKLPAYENLRGEPSKRLRVNVISPLEFGKVDTEAERVLQTIRKTQTLRAKSGKAKEAFDKQAKEKFDELKALPPERASEQFQALVKSDRALAEQVSNIASKTGLSAFEANIVKSLGVKNGDRARFVFDQLQEMTTPEQKSALWGDYVKKKIITKEVGKQLNTLLAQ